MMQGRYALATRNISADDVTSVDVYENHQAKRVLKDISLSDRAALNLKLKKRSMLRPMGYVKAGAGIDDDKSAKWLGEAFGMFISPGFQSLVTVKGNDMGQSYADETKSQAESESTINSEAYGIYPQAPFGSADIPSSRYFDNKAMSASISAVTRLGKFTMLNATADYTDDDNSYDNNERITYSNGDLPGIVFEESVVNNPHLRKANFVLGIEKNAPESFVSDKFTFNGRFKSNSYDISSARTIDQRVKTEDYNFRNFERRSVSIFLGYFGLGMNLGRRREVYI